MMYVICILTEHEGPVTAVNISSDGVKILAGTSSVCFTIESKDLCKVIYCMI